jgi:hypothetical protein
MPIPVIYQSTSVHGLMRGRPFAFQPALAPGSPAASSWQLLSGTLPSGLTLNATTGKISGTPDSDAEGSTYTLGLSAVNADGVSAPLVLTMGVEYAPVEADGGLTAIIDLDTGVVGFPECDQRTEENRAVAHVRRGDAYALSVVFVRRGTVIDLPVTAMRVTGKKEETDPPIPFQAPGDYLVYKEGSGETARYNVWLSLRDEQLATDLEDASAARGTAVPYVCEIRWMWTRSMGESSARTAERSSLEFVFVVHRDSLP